MKRKVVLLEEFKLLRGSVGLIYGFALIVLLPICFPFDIMLHLLLSWIRAFLVILGIKQPLPHFVRANDCPPNDVKSGARVLFVPSDNSMTSGAFRSMVALMKLIRDKHGMDPIAILPCKGSGTRLLEEYGLPFFHVESFDWVLPLGDSPLFPNNSYNIVKRLIINHFAIKRIGKIIIRYQVDLIHINTTWTYVGAIAAMAQRIPFVWHLREYLEEDKNSTLWNRSIGNKIINMADAVITISNGVYNKYVSVIDNKKLIRIYNGIDHNRFYMPEHTVMLSRPYLFMFLGGIIEAKGVLEFSKACAALYASGFHDFCVYFVGGGDMRLRRTCEEIFESVGMSCKVTFCGQQLHPENYLQMADIAFTCSKAEAFGRVTVEAMQAGCLVIGAHRGSTAELIIHGHTGLLYSAENPVEDLCSKMMFAINNPDIARKCAATGRDFMVANMTAERNAYEINKLYLSVIGKKKFSVT